MPIVTVRENDSFEVALRRFKRSCEKAGVISKLRSSAHYEKPTTTRKRKKAAARKRELKRVKKETESLERNRARRFNFETSVTKPQNSNGGTAPATTTEASTETATEE